MESGIGRQGVGRGPAAVVGDVSDRDPLLVALHVAGVEVGRDAVIDHLRFLEGQVVAVLARIAGGRLGGGGDGEQTGGGSGSAQDGAQGLVH